MFASRAQQERSIPGAVATLGVNERVTFLRKTYAHLAGAIGLFVLLEFLLLDSGSPLFAAVTEPILRTVFSGSSMTWLVFLGLFMVVGFIADKWARSDTSRGMQYVGLGLYVVAEAIIFLPMLFIAEVQYPGVIADAAILTLMLFAGLTATVFITKKDFSFLRGALGLGMVCALGLILLSALFGFHLGIVFSGAMLLLASGYVLYYTSQVLAHYRPTQYVSASLALFAAIALLFWYVLRILMELRD